MLVIISRDCIVEKVGGAKHRYQKVGGAKMSKFRKTFSAAPLPTWKYQEEIIPYIIKDMIQKFKFECLHNYDVNFIICVSFVYKISVSSYFLCTSGYKTIYLRFFFCHEGKLQFPDKSQSKVQFLHWNFNPLSLKIHIIYLTPVTLGHESFRP